MSAKVEVSTLVPQPAVAVRVVVPMAELDVGEMFGAGSRATLPVPG